MVPVGRTKGAWRYVAAAGIALSLALVGQSFSEPKGKTEHHHGANAAGPVASSPDAAKWYRSPTKQDCDSPESAEQEEVCLARRSANAAAQQVTDGRVANHWAHHQARLNAIQAVGLLASLFFTGWAAVAAGRAAKAAEGSVSIAQVAAAKQLRPYVFLGGKPDPDSITHIGSAVLLAKNFGQTPARNVTRQRGFAFDSPVGTVTKVTLAQEIRELGDIGPGGQMELHVFMNALSAGQFQKIISGEAEYVIRTRIEYDVDGGRDWQDLTVTVASRYLVRGRLGFWRPPSEKREIQGDV